MAGLLSLSFTDEPRLAEVDTAGAGVGPWIEAIEVLMRRAVDRGEFPPADVSVLARVVPMLCIARAVQHEPITREFSLTMIDEVIVPAMRGGSLTPRSTRPRIQGHSSPGPTPPDQPPTAGARVGRCQRDMSEIRRLP